MSESLVMALERARMEVIALVSPEDGRYTVATRNNPESHRTAIKTQLDKLQMEWLGSRYDVANGIFRLTIVTRRSL